MDLEPLRKVLGICNGSEDSATYARYLGRPGFDIESFLNSVELFARGRDVNFSELPEDKKVVRKKLLKELRRDSASSLKDIIRLLKKNLSSVQDKPAEPYEIAAVLTGKIEEARVLLSEEEPSAYLELMNQKSAGDTDAAGVLFSLSDIDSTKRWGILRSLSDIGIYVDPESVDIIPFDQSFRSEGIEGFIAKDRKMLLRKGFEGISSDNELLVASRSAVQHELQHVFDNIAMMGSEKGNEVDGEFRAYVSELVFSDERMQLCKEWVKISDKNAGKSGLEAHEAAQVLIGELMKGIDLKSENDIVEEARRIMDEAYRKIVGLTYGQIIEPFVMLMKEEEK